MPFLDNDLVDFAMRVPVGLKLGNLGEVVRLNENEPGPKTAAVLRAHPRRQADPAQGDGAATFRPRSPSGDKQGFSAPDASWFRGESIDYVRRRLVDGDAAIYDYLDRDTVRSLVDDHIEGRENRRLLIWSLLSVEQWCETFLGAPTAP